MDGPKKGGSMSQAASFCHEKCKNNGIGNSGAGKGRGGMSSA